MTLLGTIDLNKAHQRPKLSICKPSGQKIAELREAHDITNDIFLGKVNELQFLVSYDIESKHELIPNPNIDKLKQRYLIKLELANIIEYFIINNVYDNGNEDKSEKTVHCYSLAWQMNDKLIRGYQDNVNASTALNVGLSETTWNIGYVDADFDIRTRNFDVSEKTVLDFIFEICDSFGAIVEFDTVNRLVSLKKEDSIGQNKGLRLSYGKYLQSLTKQSFSDEMVSRLHVFGNEDLSIQNLNMTGTTFLENFSYFMYPFEMDANGNVIKHSEYMSDNLCKKQLAYQNLIATRTPTFKDYLTQLEQHQTTLSTLTTEMSTLVNEKKIIDDKIYLAKGQEQDTTVLDIELANKQAEIDNKQAEIDATNANITTVNNNITALRNEVSIENNFTADEIKERNYYIIEKTWQDDTYIDEQDLYDEAIKRFADMKEPKTTFTIDIVNFLSIVECQRDWDKLSIGDTVTIEYEQLGVNITAKIIEIHANYEDDSISLTIANTKEILNETIKLAKKIYDAYSTSTSLDMSKYKWDNSVAQLGEVNAYINNSLDTAKQEILAGVNNSISISNKGIVVTDPTTPNNQIIIQSGIIALSNSGGSTWNTAIRPSGIVAERLMGKIIAGVNLTIENQSGLYAIDGNGFNITRSDDKVKIGLTATDGIKIQSKDIYGIWHDKFYVDTNGNIIANDITANNGTFNGTINSSVINTSSLNTPTITGGSINIGNGVFTVDNLGNMVANKGTFGGDLVIKNPSGYTITTIKKETIGGQVRVYDEFGSLNAVMGSESGTGQNVGGTMTLHNDGVANKRVALGIIGSSDYGTMQLLDTNTTVRIDVRPNMINLRDSSGVVVTSITEGSITVGNSSLTSTYGNINGDPIATQTWVSQRYYSSGDSPTFGAITATSINTTNNIVTDNNMGCNILTAQTEVRANGVVLTSNAEYKKNITDYLGDALGEINTTPIREFHFLNELDTEKKHVGIILQESPVEVADILGKGVDVYSMVSMSWKAVQQLSAKFDSMQQEINTLKGV